MKNILGIMLLAFAELNITGCSEGDPFNGQGMRPSVDGVSDADIVAVEKAYYDARYKELTLEWKDVASEFDGSFLGTEVTLTSHSGKVVTTEIMRDKNFPQAYGRTVVATKSPQSVIYRSIWRGKEGERIYSDYCKLNEVSGLEIQNVEYGREVSFKNMHMPQWLMSNQVEGTPESDLYYKILGNPPYGFCEAQLKTICGAMWFNERDPYIKLKQLECQFKPSDILAYVTWEGDKTIMCVSQNHVKGLLSSPFDEARDELVGVCYHELTHTMQVGVSSSNNFDHQCYVEGGADASRLICGGFSEKARLDRSRSAVAKAEDQTTDPKNPPHPWLNPYSDSGFFMAWLRRYDGDFWRKLNYSTQILVSNDWTFEGAVKLIFADNKYVQEEIEKQGCKNDILRGLWRAYKQDVESETLE